MTSIASSKKASKSNASSESPSVQWIGDEQGFLRLLDQTRLPTEEVWIDCRDVATVWEAIVSLRVRGAPAIGIAAAYGVCLAVHAELQAASGVNMIAEARERYAKACDYLATSRPTAVNLFWAIDRLRKVLNGAPDESSKLTSVQELAQRLLNEAIDIHDEDRAMCHAIGRFGAELLRDGSGVLTHCNAGGLATAEYGTALSAIFTAHDQGKKLRVYADETRPLLQGARLTAWELQKHGVPCTVICDSMAAQVMREGKIQAVIVGADRITARGDTANKIGTYSVAILAAYHKIPFYVAAPSSTFDLSIVHGAEIPIEQRKAEEITMGFGKQTAPAGIDVYNPAFDVTPAELITGIITEKGIIQPVDEEHVRGLMSS